MRFAGEKMQRIRLQKPVGDKDPETGQVVESWADVDSDPNPWAKVRDQRGSELFQSDKKTARAVKIFQIHMRDDFDEEHTIVDELSGRRYDIQRIHRIGNRKLDVEAEWTQGKYDE